MLLISHILVAFAIIATYRMYGKHTSLYFDMGYIKELKVSIELSICGTDQIGHGGDRVMNLFKLRFQPYFLIYDHL